MTEFSTPHDCNAIRDGTSVIIIAILIVFQSASRIVKFQNFSFENCAHSLFALKIA